ncbi:hypothetical protein ACIBJE_18680 [Micromonospora sp. NPDC050187]|uniref:hypothetical protein n=1 Tax=Micromonospora sp. NPDC050187 TaxID=3364277 RepID=UPI003789ADC7
MQVVATGTLVFLVIGAVSVVVLAFALLGGELLHAVHPNLDGPVSLEVVAGFTGALGFGGAIANELIGGDSPAMVAGAAGVGVLAAVPAAWFAARLGRAARTMHTDPTPTRAHLVGALGLVVTPIPTTGYGEVRVRLAGQPVKLNARADRPLPVGTQVFVVESLSETSVHVEPY